MPEYLAPDVYVEEVNTGSKPIEGVSTSTAGMVGVTQVEQPWKTDKSLRQGMFTTIAYTADSGRSPQQLEFAARTGDLERLSHTFVRRSINELRNSESYPKASIGPLQQW